MAATVTMAELKTRVLRRADMSSPDTFPDTTTNGEVETYIQEAGREFYDFILEAWGEDYFLTSAALLTAAGVATVALPSDFYKLVGLDATTPGSDTPVVLRKFNLNERNAFPGTTGWDWYGVTPMYRLRGLSSLWLIPTPTGAHSLTLYYVPTMTDIDDGTNVLDGINGWEEYVVLRAAIKLLRREESDTSGLDMELAACKERIHRVRAPRDIAEPGRVTDVYAIAQAGWNDL